MGQRSLQIDVGGRFLGRGTTSSDFQIEGK